MNITDENLDHDRGVSKSIKDCQQNSFSDGGKVRGLLTLQK